MRPWRQCSIPAAAAPRKDTSWADARDDRPWGGTSSGRLHLRSRSRRDALKLLDHYRGIVQCDGYAAYKTIANAASDEAITLAFCWAHLRRRFFDIAEGGPASNATA